MLFERQRWGRPLLRGSGVRAHSYVWSATAPRLVSLMSRVCREERREGEDSLSGVRSNDVK